MKAENKSTNKKAQKADPIIATFEHLHFVQTKDMSSKNNISDQFPREKHEVYKAPNCNPSLEL